MDVLLPDAMTNEELIRYVDNSPHPSKLEIKLAIALIEAEITILTRDKTIIELCN